MRTAKKIRQSHSNMKNRTEQNGEKLVQLMGSVVDRREKLPNTLERLENLCTKIAKFDRMLAMVSNAAETLYVKADRLSSNVSSLRDLSQPTDQQKEYSFLSASGMIKRVVTSRPFSLSFHLIDRQGVIYKPDPHEVFQISVREDSDIRGREKRKRSESEDILHGLTTTNATQDGEICFKDLYFQRSTRFLGSERFTLTIESLDNLQIRPLEIDSISVVLPNKKPKIRGRQRSSLPL